MPKYFDTTVIDKKKKPGKDFYKYAVGGWLKKNKIPHDKARWCTFDVLHEQNQQKLKKIVTHAAKQKKPKEQEKIVADFYKSGLHKKRNLAGTKPLEGLLHDISKIDSEQEFLSYVALCHEIGINIFWILFVAPDEKKSEKMALYLYQGGLTLPDREYYISDDVAYKKIRAQYKKHFTRMAKHFPEVKVKTFHKNVLSIEMFLAKKARTKTQIRDVHKQYNKMSISTLAKKSKNIKWQSYMEDISVKTKTDVIVGQPEYFGAVGSAMKDFSLQARKDYMLWRIITSLAPLLSEEIYEAHFTFFLKEISGIKQVQPRWKRVIASIDTHVGEALGALFVKEHFPESAKKAAQDLSTNIRQAFAERLKKNDWMHVDTKKKALEKLRRMRIKIGYPEKLEKYEGLEVLSTDYFGNVLRARMYQHAKEIHKIGKRTDRNLWEMTPQTVNAYYHPLHNEMVFPAGILQAPFFDAKADAALNYGGIGTVIAHEITHGFDDQGSLYDSKGNINTWWKKEDKKQFDILTKKIIAQYDAFEALPGLNVQGALTVGENIADLGGVMIALHALESTKKDMSAIGEDDLTVTQRFFHAYALTEAGKQRPEQLRKQIVTDPHAPGNFRVNGPLTHTEAFYRAFNIHEKSSMYTEPKKRITIW